MKNSTNLVISIIVILLVFFGIYYFFLSGDSPELAQAKQELEVETKKLNELNSRYSEERAVISQLQKQYETLRGGIVKQMDYFFTDAESDNPTLILKLSNKTLEKDFNKRRLEITRLLKEWDKKMADLNSDYSSESFHTLKGIITDARSNIAYVQEYIIDLGTVINELTPNSSQLQQSQIYTYQSIIEKSIDEVTQLTSNIDAIEEQAEQIYIANGIASNTESSSSSSGNTSSGQDNTNQASNSNTPIVTNSQIQEQEQVVVQAQNNVNNVQQGNATSTPYVPVSGTPNTVQIDNSYYQGYSQGGSQTVIEYLRSLPSSNSDKTGWPDRSSENSGDPSFTDN